MTLAWLARKHPRVVDRGIQLDRIAPIHWLALQAAALTPTWLWMVARWRDGPHDPLVLLMPLVLAALGAAVWTQRRALRVSPRLGWLALATAGTLAATFARGGLAVAPLLSPLASAWVAVLALACGLLAFLPRRTAAWPVVIASIAVPGGRRVDTDA